MHFNLEFFLVAATVVSGIFLLLWRYVFKKPGVLRSVSDSIGSLFVVFLIVLVIRSFLVEPFRIPSGSMLPTLEVGDFILVNKYRYGIRLPVLRSKLVELDEPQRGDVVVFKYPQDTQHDFIKRVIGVPGDRVEYRDKTVYINGEPLAQTLVGDGESYAHKEYLEDLGSFQHAIALRTNRPAYDGSWDVKEGHYFVMGDNRDNSNDSRSWGLVPERLMVGKAFMIWLHWDWNEGDFNVGRMGMSIE